VLLKMLLVACLYNLDERLSLTIAKMRTRAPRQKRDPGYKAQQR
jgi:hypothetical protein